MVCGGKPHNEPCENRSLPTVFIAGKEISHKVQRVHEVHKEDRLATFYKFPESSVASRSGGMPHIIQSQLTANHHLAVVIWRATASLSSLTISGFP
jgi:hypothetical protein